MSEKNAKVAPTITHLQDAGESELLKCVDVLKETSWFMFCSESNLKLVAEKMRKEEFKAGDTIIFQGEAHERMYIVGDGCIDRLRTIEGRRHLMEVDERGSTVGAFYIMNKDPCYSDAKCRTDVVCYSITNESLMPLFDKPSFAREVAYNLNLEIRRQLRVAVELGRTPLLEQEGKSTPFLAVSIAASIESFYRSAMNASINAALSGQTRVAKGALFPNMHLQVPTRVMYINGFKGIRHWLDNNQTVKDAHNTKYPTLIRLAAAITPGLCMTPVSSVLEAYNAGSSNSEPLSIRWTRGVVPRSLREVIFGVGLNQLSDYCEERTDFISNKFLRNVVASISAGVIAGYLSHVPHNMSTLKILNPQKSYRELFMGYVKLHEDRLPAGIAPNYRRALSYVVSFFAPRGLLIRTSQIVGSFIILNGTINALQSNVFDRESSAKSAQLGIDTTELLVHPRNEIMRRVKLHRAEASGGGGGAGSAGHRSPTRAAGGSGIEKDD